MLNIMLWSFDKSVGYHDNMDGGSCIKHMPGIEINALAQYYTRRLEDGYVKYDDLCVLSRH